MILSLLSYPIGLRITQLQSWWTKRRIEVVSILQDQTIRISLSKDPTTVAGSYDDQSLGPCRATCRHQFRSALFDIDESDIAAAVLGGQSARNTVGVCIVTVNAESKATHVNSV